MADPLSALIDTVKAILAVVDAIREIRARRDMFDDLAACARPLPLIHCAHMHSTRLCLIWANSTWASSHRPRAFAPEIAVSRYALRTAAWLTPDECSPGAVRIHVQIRADTSITFRSP